MNVIGLTEAQFKEIMRTLQEIRTQFNVGPDGMADFIDNAEFIKLMKISKRTAQLWRDEGKIAFSQIGNKIYYKHSDVDELLKKYYNRTFRK
ncbi:MAG: helix-turn-helix domain-containing protein [Chitinophagales bacterium]